MQSRTLYLLFAASFLVAWVSAQTDAKTLVDLVNTYRADNNLPAIPMSYSLTKTGILHTLDLNANGIFNASCNMLSWSNQGSPLWTACCYKPDHSNSECSWNKLREVTEGTYTGDGYENTAYSAEISPTRALDLWKRNANQNNVILNKADWELYAWKAIGGAICGQYAVLWFSYVDDPDTRDATTLTCESFSLPNAAPSSSVPSTTGAPSSSPTGSPTTAGTPSSAPSSTPRTASGPSGKTSSAQAMGSAFSYVLFSLLFFFALHC